MSPSCRSPGSQPLPTTTLECLLFIRPTSSLFFLLQVKAPPSSHLSSCYLLPITPKCKAGLHASAWSRESGLGGGRHLASQMVSCAGPLRPQALLQAPPVSAFAVPGEVASPEIRWLPPAYSAFLLGSHGSALCPLRTATTAPVPGPLILEET